MMEAGKTSKTLFIRNLPFTTTNDKLETVFGEVGPLKRCFVVKEKGSDTCRGFGYVTFSTHDDAKQAKESIKSLDGRKLFIAFSDHKEKVKKKEKKESQRNEQKSEEKKQIANSKESITKQKRRAACTVILTGFKIETTYEEVSELTKDLKNLNDVQFPDPEREEPTAIVRFHSKRDAVKASKKLNEKKIRGAALKAILHSKEHAMKSQKILKRCRLIIRNLSFKSNEDELQKTFAKFGEISEVKIPTRKDGKKLGFGFVQFCDINSAAKAMKEINAKPIHGRPVAVDWAVPKDKFEKTDDGVEDTNNESDKSTSEEESDEEKEDKPSAKKSKKNTKVSEVDESSGEDSDEASEEEDEVSESDEEIEDEPKKTVKKVNAKHSLQDESDSDSDDEENDNEEEESDEEVDDSEDEEDSEDDSMKDSMDISDSEDEDQVSQKKKKKNMKQSTDVEEGKTLFIRNISFDTEEEDLEEMLSQFGEIKYCRLVIDPETEHPRGTAFVQFNTKEAAEKCLEAANNDNSKDGALMLDKRQLFISQAVTREKAEEMRKHKKDKEKADNRNLYLVREGLIRPGTQAAEGLSKADLDRRMKVEAIKRQKLKNPNVFVSTTRLCVRNIPVKIDDKALKDVFLKAAEDKKAKINECRVMRDFSQVNASGVAKSKGYAFVNFTNHQHALTALRNTNNNPETYGPKKRLIVEFSLENRQALSAKQKRYERHESKKEMLKQMKEGIKTPTKRKKKQKETNQSIIPETTTATAPNNTVEKQKGPKGLPSHWGPKIRHKPRGQAKIAKKPKDKLSRSEAKANKLKRKADNTIEEVSQREQPAKKKKKSKGNKKKKFEREDNFEKLVNKYKQQMSGTATKTNKKKQKGKWFD